MRYHRRGRPYVLRHDASAAAAIMHGEHLAIARLEPALSNREEAILDLVFEKDGRFAVLPLAIVDSAFIIGRESSPFAWPAGTSEFVAEPLLLQLERRLEPWLRSRLLARCENDEVIKFFKDEEGVRDAFERARSLELYGATPLAQVLSSAAPAVYAYRFAAGGRVAFPDCGFANSAALLYGRVERVDGADRSVDDECFARNWFGTQAIDVLDRSAAYDLVIANRDPNLTCAVEIRCNARVHGATNVSFSRPLPLATFVSFDTADSALQGEFSVTVHARSQTARTSHILAPAAVGGSRGRVALLVREDWSRADDADSDAIRALDCRLSAEGFSVRIIEGWSNVDPSDIDLVHVMGICHASTIRAKIERLRDAGIPIVTSPLIDDPKGEMPWGVPLAQSAFRNSVEDATLDYYLRAIALRRLNADGVPLHQSLPLEPSDDARRVLNCSGAVIVSGSAEESLVRARFGYAGLCVTVAPFVRTVDAVNVDAIVGLNDFILMHAAIDARNAVVMAALAAEIERLPVVLCGPVADAETMQFLHAFAGNSLRYVPGASISEQHVEGLYARARVFADVSWGGRGLSRLARAGGYGASLVASMCGNASSVWGENVHLADPADLQSIANAFRVAWISAPAERERMAARTATQCDQGSALVATVRAYQQAAHAGRKTALAV